MIEYKPYCYLLGWSKLDKWYYGSEYGHRTKIANPLNLWHTYFTSSKYVKEFVKIHGNPDIIKIRKICSTDVETIHWEYRVLRKLKVKNNARWLNVNEGKAPVGTPWTEEHRISHSNRMSGESNPMYGKRHSTRTKELISEKSGRSGKENGMYGKNHTIESKTKMSLNHHRIKTMLNKLHTDESKEKMSNGHNPTKYVYSHLTHGRIITTMRQMNKLYPELKFSGLRALSTGRLKTYKGWSLQNTTCIS